MISAWSLASVRMIFSRVILLKGVSVDTVIQVSVS